MEISDDALYKSTFILLYLTLTCKHCKPWSRRIINLLLVFLTIKNKVYSLCLREFFEHRVYLRNEAAWNAVQSQPFLQHRVSAI